MSACNRDERDAELKTALADLIRPKRDDDPPRFLAAIVVALYECPVHGPHIGNQALSIQMHDQPNQGDPRDQIRQVIQSMREYADDLEKTFLGRHPQAPLRETPGPRN